MLVETPPKLVVQTRLVFMCAQGVLIVLHHLRVAAPEEGEDGFLFGDRGRKKKFMRETGESENPFYSTTLYIAKGKNWAPG